VTVDLPCVLVAPEKVSVESGGAGASENLGIWGLLRRL